MENTEVEEIIEKVYKLIKKTEEIQTIEETKHFIGKEDNENFSKLLSFYDDFITIASKYLYSYKDDKEQYQFSQKTRKIIKWILENKEIFEYSEYYDHVPDAILNNIDNKEKNHVFKLMFEGRIKDFDSELEYQNFRKEIEEILINKDESKRSDAEIRYLRGYDNYKKNFFSHSINMFEKNFFDIPEKMLDEFLDQLDKSNYLDDIIYSDERKLGFEDENLIFQYTRFVLKLKSIFKPNEIAEDKVIQGIYNGKIKNSNVINIIFSNKDTESIENKEKKKIGNPFEYARVFKELLEKDGKNTEHYYLNLVEHFKNVGMDDKNINKILREIILDDDEENSLQFLADLEIKKEDDIVDFIKKDGEKNHSYITNNMYLFDLLKENEEKVIEGRLVCIPYNYVFQNIESLSRESTDNIQTLIEDGFYTDEQSDNLKRKMIENKKYTQREEIPYEKARKLIRDNIDNGFRIDEETFKSCIRAIIQKTLKDRNIEFGKGIFFGEDKTTNGIHLHSKNLNGIWINNELVRQFLKNNSNNPEKVKVFETMFHEIKHVEQCSKMEKGEIDYLTYNFIKEDIIRDIDPSFYDANYYKIFVEEDARQFGIIDSMKFLKSLGIRDFDKIYEAYKKKLSTELDNTNINKDSSKKMPFRGVEDLDISDYLGKIIKNNPEILNEYNGILKIEYNADGSQKNIEEILNQFNAIETEEEQNKIFSVYYGIINSKYIKMEKDKISSELKEKIDEFFEMKKILISTQDMRHYFEKSDPIVNTVILRKFDEEIRGESNKKTEEKNAMQNGETTSTVERNTKKVYGGDER